MDNLIKSCKYCGAIILGIMVGYALSNYMKDPINLKDNKKNSDKNSNCSCSA